MRKIFQIFLVFLIVTFPLWGEDITLRDGTVYQDARVVSHDETSAQILHRNGGVTVPISQLSEELQKSLGYDPAKAAPILAQTGEQTDFQAALRKYYLIDGKLAPRVAVTPIVLNFKLLQETDATDPAGSPIGHGSYVEIYDPNYVPSTPPAEAVAPPTNDDGTTNNAVVVALPVPEAPGPHDTGRKAFLVNYIAASNTLVTLKGARQGVTSNGDPYYLVVTETFTLDDWRNAGSPK